MAEDSLVCMSIDSPNPTVPITPMSILNFMDEANPSPTIQGEINTSNHYAEYMANADSKAQENSAVLCSEEPFDYRLGLFRDMVDHLKNGEELEVWARKYGMPAYEAKAILLTRLVTWKHRQQSRMYEEVDGLPHCDTALTSAENGPIAMDPLRVGGEPAFPMRRLSIENFINHLGSGYTVPEFAKAFDVSTEQANEVLIELAK